MMQSDGLWSGPIDRPKRSLPRPMVAHLPAKTVQNGSLWILTENFGSAGRNNPQLRITRVPDSFASLHASLRLHWL